MSAAASGISPRRVFAQGSGPARVMNALSTYMGAAPTRALPEEVTEHAKHHLLDTIAAMISGSELPPGQAAQRYIREHGGNGAVAVVASAGAPAPLHAALAHGGVAPARENHDPPQESPSPPRCAGGPAGRAPRGKHRSDATWFVCVV